jgi:hypothetical protein
MSCIKSNNDKYSKRPSPPYPAQNCKNLIKTGNNGKKYISASDKNGIYRWKSISKSISRKRRSRSIKNSLNPVKSKSRSKSTFIKKENIKPKNYITHDNGGRPFLVDISKDLIRIYTHDNTEYDVEPKKSDYTVLIKEISNFNGYWYGFDNSNFNKKTNGTSILIEVEKLRYIFIGVYVIEFVTNEPIIEFRSTMGNSDVTYPYAWSENKIYMFIYEHVQYMNRKDVDIDVQSEKSVWINGFFNKTYKNNIKNLKQSILIHDRKQF